MEHDFEYIGIKNENNQDYHVAKCKNLYCEYGILGNTDIYTKEEFIEKLRNPFTGFDLPVCPFESKNENLNKKESVTIDMGFMFYKTFEGTLFLIFPNGEKRLATDIEKELYKRLSSFESNGKIDDLSKKLDNIIRTLDIISACQNTIVIKEQIDSLVSIKKEIDAINVSLGTEESLDIHSHFRGMSPEEIRERARNDPEWWNKHSDIILNAYKNGYYGGYEKWMEKHNSLRIPDWLKKLD